MNKEKKINYRDPAVEMLLEGDISDAVSSVKERFPDDPRTRRSVIANLWRKFEERRFAKEGGEEQYRKVMEVNEKTITPILSLTGKKRNF